MLASLLVALLGVLAPPSPAASPLRVLPLKGEPVVLASWEIADGRIRGRRQEGGQDFSMSLRSVWMLAPVSPTPPAASDGDGPFFQIRSGPRLAGRLRGGDADHYRFQLEFGGEGDIARTYLRGLRMADGAAPATGDEGFLDALGRPPDEQDLLFIYDDKGRVRRFRGKAGGIVDKALQFTLGDRSLSLELDRLYGIVFAETSGIEAPVGDATGLVSVSLFDGRVLRAVLLGAKDDAPISLRMLEGLPLTVPLPFVREIEFISDRLAYLSSLPLQPQSRQVPALARDWSLLRDRGIAGPLRLDTRVYRRGFLVVPPATLVFDLGRPFDRLLGEVGLPAGRVGSARLRVLAGERQLGEAIELHADGKPWPLDLPLDGASALTLELSATDDLDAGAQVILGDVRVVID